MTPINPRDFLRSRRSIRRFKPDEVPEGILSEILQTATFAPSAHNSQPWRFAIVKTAALKNQLADAMSAEFQRELESESLSAEEISKRVERSRNRIKSAPVVIILCLDAGELTLPKMENERVMMVQSVANAGLQLLLAAHAEGLGGVWMGSPLYTQAIVQKVLGLKTNWEPQAMLLIGYADEVPSQRARKALAEVCQEIKNP